ncbi:hypothetical protein SRHO_G00258400 [Serrasalmus rhombeus]
MILTVSDHRVLQVEGQVEGWVVSLLVQSLLCCSSSSSVLEFLSGRRRSRKLKQWKLKCRKLKCRKLKRRGWRLTEKT